MTRVTTKHLMLARQVANEACPSLLLVFEEVVTAGAAAVLILPLDQDHVPVLPGSLKINENLVLLKTLFMSSQQN